MTQADRTWLFNTAYGLDNRRRIRITRKNTLELAKLPIAEGDALAKARMQGKTGDLYVFFTEKELAKLADAMREIAAIDEDRLIKRIAG